MLLPKLIKTLIINILQQLSPKILQKVREEALIEIYRKMRPGEPAVLENAEALFASLVYRRQKI